MIRVKIGLVAMAFGVMAPLAAGDGVTEISQSRVEASGGFPFTISSPGSYRLTSDLDVTGEPTPQDVNAISITASHVQLDLNGFQIKGLTFCSASSPTTCVPTGSGSGITGIFAQNVKVFNGSVRGMGDRGIRLGSLAQTWDLQLTDNGAAGLALSSNAIVERVTANRNGGDGISVGGNSIVTRCIAKDNGDDGITGTSGNVFSGNASHSNDGDGIDAGTGSLIEGNTCRQNAGYGLRTSTGSNPATGYKDNILSSNTLGEVTGGIQIGTNICSSNTTCP